MENIQRDKTQGIGYDRSVKTYIGICHTYAYRNIVQQFYSMVDAVMVMRVLIHWQLWVYLGAIFHGKRICYRKCWDLHDTATQKFGAGYSELRKYTMNAVYVGLLGCTDGDNVFVDRTILIVTSGRNTG